MHHHNRETATDDNSPLAPGFSCGSRRTKSETTTASHLTDLAVLPALKASVDSVFAGFELHHHLVNRVQFRLLNSSGQGLELVRYFCSIIAACCASEPTES